MELSRESDFSIAMSISEVDSMALAVLYSRPLSDSIFSNGIILANAINCHFKPCALMRLLIIRYIQRR